MQINDQTNVENGGVLKIWPHQCGLISSGNFSKFVVSKSNILNFSTLFLGESWCKRLNAGSPHVLFQIFYL